MFSDIYDTAILKTIFGSFAPLPVRHVADSAPWLVRQQSCGRAIYRNNIEPTIWYRPRVCLGWSYTLESSVQSHDQSRLPAAQPLTVQCPLTTQIMYTTITRYTS